MENGLIFNRIATRIDQFAFYKKLSSEALIKLADDALYRTKGLGRNPRCVAGRD